MSPSRPSGYCGRCDAERDILSTVPWQDDVCATCGSTDVVLE